MSRTSQWCQRSFIADGETSNIWSAACVKHIQQVFVERQANWTNSARLRELFPTRKTNRETHTLQWQREITQRVYLGLDFALRDLAVRQSRGTLSTERHCQEFSKCEFVFLAICRNTNSNGVLRHSTA